MSLFDYDSQYREKAAIWRLLGNAGLFSGLASGRVWKWFAVNIPMDLGTGGKFTSDIDILACLREYPDYSRLVYRSWEVKVSRLHADGSASSLKAGKLRRTVNQLQAYCDYGLPEVSLLELYICESGFMQGHGFPPSSILEVVGKKLPELHRMGCGYHILPIEYSVTNGREDTGSFTVAGPIFFNAVVARLRPMRDPFPRLAAKIDGFAERTPTTERGFHHIVFCRACRQLQRIRMRDTFECPNCRDNLIKQS